MPEPAHAVTMWDFSWLLRRSGAEAEYADVDRVLDELAERGYDVVRIDAFPHWIAADRDGVVHHEIVSVPQSRGFMWGNHHEVTVRPRTALLEFLGGLRSRGIRAGLSSWFTPDSRGLAGQIRTPDDLGRVWTETLRVVRDAGLLDTVAYVDLCNEWPAWLPGVVRAVMGEHVDNLFAQTDPFTAEQLHDFDDYRRALAAVRAEVPGIPLTLSYYLRGVEPPLSTDVMRFATDSFDFGEPHLWLTAACPQFVKATEWTGDFEHSHDDLVRHAQRVRELWPTRRAEFLAELATLMDDWRDWGVERDLPLWTTEGWASVGWSPDAVPGWTGWDYVRDVADAAVGMAIERGWQGICTSNFSQPHHVGMWADARWHRDQTDRIHGK